MLRRITDAIVLSGQAEEVWIETVDTKLDEVTCVARSGGKIPAKDANCPYAGSLAEAVLANMASIALQRAITVGATAENRGRGASPGRDLTASVENVIRTRQAFLLHEVSDQILRAHSVDAEHLDLLRQPDLKSAIVVPMTVGLETIGALVFLAAGTRRYVDDDLKRATKIGRRAALAIHNAQLYAVANEAIQLREGVLRTVAHDLRNPLNAIMLSARWRVESTLPSEKRPKLLESIADASDRMNRLIDDLLMTGRLGANQELPIDLHREDPTGIVEQVCEIMAHLAVAKSVTLKSGATRPALPAIIVDRARILQVLTNLLDNALKFTPRGEEHLERIFDPFWQARETAHRGAGLGLAIAKAIIEQHHGRIWVESNPGSGTTVSFTLQVAGVDEERSGRIAA